MATETPECDESCPECKGNQHIGGDLMSPWACTTWVRRHTATQKKNEDQKNK